MKYYIISFFPLFVLYHLVGCLVFPSKNGYLVYPSWYIPAGIVWAIVASIVIKKLSKKQECIFNPKYLAWKFASPQRRLRLFFISSEKMSIKTVWRFAYDNGIKWETANNYVNDLKAKGVLDANWGVNDLETFHEPKTNNLDPLLVADSMEGHDFEKWCANLLEKNGFCDVVVTKVSGDHGVDILAKKQDISYAIQCKCYTHDLGNTPVQEIYAGKEMYDCQVAAVMTNRYFTDGAKALASKTRVMLWDRDKLKEFIELSNP